MKILTADQKKALADKFQAKCPCPPDPNVPPDPNCAKGATAGGSWLVIIEALAALAVKDGPAAAAILADLEAALGL